MITPRMHFRMKYQFLKRFLKNKWCRDVWSKKKCIIKVASSGKYAMNLDYCMINLPLMFL